MSLAQLQTIQKVLAILVGAFVFYTAATGPFEGLIQRALFLALVTALGFALYPLGADKGWRPVGLVFDLVLCTVVLASCGYVVWNYDEIMSSLPWATMLDKVLTVGLVLAVLELGRRTVGLIFPVLVLAGIGYALFGNLLHGPLRHRGFDSAFVTETIFLGDLGIWGMLTGVAATVIAAFVLFGALLLHSGGGQAFMDLAMRLGGRQPGGAAKIATIASGLFGMISGSAVANVATTGNFTIPMMIRLGYPRPFAAAVEAVASTGGQIAPPIMGAAAFVMAEILGVPYTTIILGAIVPAVLFYASVFVTVHFVAVKRGLAIVPEDELPAWAAILAPRRVAPILCALAGLGIGIWLGRSIATAAFYGVVGLLIAFVVTEAGRLSPRQMLAKIIDGLEDAGKGLVIIGVLLAGAQILVSMINLTGIGVTLSSLIVSLAGDNVPLVALIVGLVCLIMGMGLPTTAAYVLVAAVLAPAMTAVGVDPLAAHLFVFYFATISVITPPVCVAVFVGSGIAGTNWLPAAGQAVRLGAVTYLVPFLLLLYPGMLLQGGPLAIAEALMGGVALVLAVPALLVGASLTGSRALDTCILLAVIALAIWPNPVTPVLALSLLVGAFKLGQRQKGAVA
ncbi:TRAP transporter permease [Phaeobacter gallaeciensis]|uniref:TRAP transporter permease n=1 Tax=Phaeobacter gallaeciensis TaxID=60890 RepID=UPI00237F9014|nr:TRAP transporter fused permease subunit [Phaeobacter gallaeciensis]MDE4063439.1 TRAP transporter fused permease subunit [Phaeobacter gallaeciensis]MDE4126443.1 TRAP transporter fused permease subunit [Phaeobacter gallaeciensis]MDE4130937.1 TRAP transporter fused permease subunit [Phaeobacter gallaeciensis]